MADDTISTDPRMREEARRAAAESSIPKPLFMPEQIAREEFERIIDKRYCDKTFEEVWKQLTEDVASSPAKPEEIYGLFTEAEYRQLVASMLYGVNAFFLGYAGQQAHERSGVLQKAAMYTITDRMKLAEKKVDTQIDLLHALMRAPVKTDGKERKRCILHPNGCPDENGASAVRSILETILGRK